MGAIPKRHTRWRTPTPSPSPEGEDGTARKIHSLGQHIHPQDHPRPAASRRIVHRPVLVSRKVADLHRIHRPRPLSQRPPRKADTQRAGKHLRVEREDCGSEGHGSSQ
ncbi:hypothetical protein NVSP9465_02322 [Novosphingobium sp. CECT 9465]|nr:hypothetical protein NVSP9465_02322 [Novosphingobium sp. CECT 9465]